MLRIALTLVPAVRAHDLWKGTGNLIGMPSMFLGVNEMELPSGAAAAPYSVSFPRKQPVSATCVRFVDSYTHREANAEAADPSSMPCRGRGLSMAG